MAVRRYEYTRAQNRQQEPMDREVVPVIKWILSIPAADKQFGDNVKFNESWDD
jgi:hypothetical protein